MPGFSGTQCARCVPFPAANRARLEELSRFGDALNIMKGIRKAVNPLRKLIAKLDNPTTHANQFEDSELFKVAEIGKHFSAHFSDGISLHQRTELGACVAKQTQAAIIRPITVASRGVLKRLTGCPEVGCGTKSNSP